MDKNDYAGFGNGVIGGIVGTIFIIVVAVAIIIWWKPFDYKAVMIVQQEQLLSKDTPALTISEAELLQSMRVKGVVLTPAEYTNNIVSYYNTLIAFLSVFFVVFTTFSYYIVRNQSKKEVRDEARDILLESSTFKKQVLDSIKGEFDQLYLSHDDYDETIKDMREDIATLKNNNEGKEEIVSMSSVEKDKPKAKGRNIQKKTV